MTERRTQAIAQLSAVSRCGPARLNALFDDLVATGVDLEDLPECGTRVLLEKLHLTPDQATSSLMPPGLHAG